MVFGIAQDASNQTVTCAYSGTQRAATGALVYTLPRANTLFNGFGFWVSALTAQVTFAPNAADNFSGMASGASMVIPAGTQAYVATNAAGSGTWFLTLQSSVSLSSPLNLQLNASVASDNLTIAVKDRSHYRTDVDHGPGRRHARHRQRHRQPRMGRGCSTTPARSRSASITLWRGLAVLGGVGMVPWNETSGATGTAISSGVTSAQTWYTAGAITGVLRILGYVESTQTTAGQWAASPTLTRLFGPGVKKPGDLVQIQVGAASGSSASIARASRAPSRVLGPVKLNRRRAPERLPKARPARPAPAATDRDAAPTPALAVSGAMDADRVLG